MQKFNLIVLALVIGFSLITCSSQLGDGVISTPLPRIEQMPNMPEPYLIIDWSKKAMAFDSLVYNFNSTEPFGPLIWLDSSRRNIDQVT
jgi:hypothetical protein